MYICIPFEERVMIILFGVKNVFIVYQSKIEEMIQLLNHHADNKTSQTICIYSTINMYML
jgi:hypothetical protein